MVNNCTMIITKGNNKGKMCKDINRWCKHKRVYCEYCKRTFSYQHSYNGHICVNHKSRFPGPPAAPPDEYQPPSPYQHQPHQHQPHQHQPHQHQPPEKIRISLKPVVSEAQELKEMMYQLKHEINEIRNQPKVHINNLTVITDDIFSKVVTEMGKQEGVRFLLDSLTGDSECLSIVDKVYLSGKDKNEYPIACKGNNHFRFLASNRKVIDDLGGEIIVSKITGSVQDAIIRAAADTEMYDIKYIQDRIKDLTNGRDKLRDGLAVKVTNPTHPFFQC